MAAGTGRRRTAGLGALTVALCALCTASSWSPSSDPRASSLEIWATGCDTTANHGSGVALGGDLVATVAHLVAGANDLRLVDRAGHDHRGVVAAIDTERDVAVLRVDALHRPTLRRRTLRAGETGRFFGYAGATPAIVPFTVDGVVSIVSEDIYIRGEHPRPGYRVLAPVVGGDSGAGLIANDGSLGGLVWATSQDSAERGFAVDVALVDALLTTMSSDTAPAAVVPCA